MRLMKPRNQRQQREIKTEEEVIIVPQTDQDSINPDDRVVNYRNSNSELEKINGKERKEKLFETIKFAFSPFIYQG